MIWSVCICNDPRMRYGYDFLYQNKTKLYQTTRCNRKYCFHRKT
ncbi:hypothetical protein GW750_07665 [bacterium]|nr:hypothetical protein [bacterium]